MGQKLLPPILEGSIPSFYKETIDDKGTERAILSVPFSMNRSVSDSEYSKLTMRIRTIQNLNNSFNITATSQGKGSPATFILSKSTQTNVKGLESLKIGQSYKVQMAYNSSDGTVGYFSTVGIVKFTSKPTLKIEGTGLNEGSLQVFKTCRGTYINEDVTEKVYSYSFQLLKDDAIIEDSGILLHNSNNYEDQKTSFDEYDLKTTLQENQTYTLRYSITTINGLEVNTAQVISLGDNIPSELEAKLYAENNFEDGYIQLSLEANEDAESTNVSGNFNILRADNLDNYKEWNTVYSFAMSNEPITNSNLWRDFTVQQGISYQYCIQQYNIYNIYSEKIYSNLILNNQKYENTPVEADFEDAFLFDGEKQLKIRYNPKISSFKTDLLESKVDTIGSKHPFIFRNGNVEYKEFPIQGLISYFMDNNQLFCNWSDLGLSEEFNESKITTDLKTMSTVVIPSHDDEKYAGDEDLYYKEKTEAEKHNEYAALKNSLVSEKKRQLNKISSLKTPTTNLLGYNIAAERRFKIKILDWLNNGQPKLFRSPSEGNYIVRLLNTSLSPTDSLGRMIHSFSSTAYEVAEFSYQNLENYGLISSVLQTLSKEMVESINVSELFLNGKTIVFPTEPSTMDSITSFKISGEMPGVKYILSSNNSQKTTVQIGPSGSYKLSNCNITNIELDSNGIVPTGIITYSYIQKQVSSNFDKIKKITSQDKIFTYWGRALGATDTIFEGSDFFKIDGQKTSISKIYQLNFRRCPIFMVYKAWEQSWSDTYCNKKSLAQNNPINKYTPYDNCLYVFVDPSDIKNDIINVNQLKYCYKGFNPQLIGDIKNKMILDGSRKVYFTQGYTKVENIEDFFSIKVGNEQIFIGPQIPLMDKQCKINSTLVTEGAIELIVPEFHLTIDNPDSSMENLRMAPGIAVDIVLKVTGATYA